MISEAKFFIGPPSQFPLYKPPNPSSLPLPSLTLANLLYKLSLEIYSSSTSLREYIIFPYKELHN